MNARRHTFPFTALVGQAETKLALVLNAIDPQVGGVLLRGEKGTAKSTAVRALARLLPELEVVAGCPFNLAPAEVGGPACRGCPRSECVQAVAAGVMPGTWRRPVPLVELPVGASEDRLLGSLDLQRALRRGERVFQPGILAAAHRGLLYLEEVNLLPNHLVDLVLDAAASGVNRLEREGLSLSHPCRFALVGSMNPEEGELRPQLLDRFGLCVQVQGAREVETRVELLRRRELEGFRRRLADISLVVKNEDSREYDLMSSDDFNAYFGSFVAAVKAAGGRVPRAYSGDASDPQRVEMRSLAEEHRQIFRSRLLNPAWIQGLMQHGFKGAGDLARAVELAFAWDATTGVIEDWMYQALARKYAFDPQVRRWLQEVNPHALHHLAEKLLEATARGMWRADPQTRSRLEEILLASEGEVEEVLA